MTLDVSSVLGQHVWQQIVVEGTTYCVPDLTWCVSAILLIIAIFYFIKGVFSLCRTFL